MARVTLSDEMKKYGYVFSVKKSLLSFALLFALLFLLGRFFGLNAISQSVLIVAGGIMLPFLIRNSYKNRYLQRKFSDLNIYMEQFLYSFLKTGKILMTLRDVDDLFEDGDMKRTIRRAIDHIEHTFDEKDVTGTALSMIEGEYEYDGLYTLHRFAMQTEEVGGDYAGSISLLLEARRMWADRVYVLIKEKRKKRSDIVLSILTSLLLCTMVYYMAGKMDINVAAHPLAQVVTVIVLSIDLFIYYLADRKLTGGYFGENDVVMDEKEAAEAFSRLGKYSSSPLYSLPRHSLERRLTREVEKAFPQWLMQLSLLLQTENVQVAIFRSYEDAPGVIKPPLLELIGRLRRNPADKGAYTDFLSSLTLPEVRSTMKMLYSISEGSGGDAKSQISDIIRRNRQMLDKAEQLAGEDSLAGMYALFLAPQFTGGMKLMVDMLLIFIVYMGRMV